MTAVHFGQRLGILSWPAHWQAICERIASEKATLKIVTKTKNEGFFLEKWIQHHKRICDGARLIIFDNMSTDADIFEIYTKYTNDILVFSFNSYVDTIHMYNFFSKMYMALQQSCDFFTIIDSDEFLYGYDCFRLIYDNRVVKTLQDKNKINIFIPAWVDTLPGSENVFKFDPDSLYPFHFSKPIINTRMIDAFHAGHELHHAIQLPALTYGCAPTGFIVLHMKNLNKAQRIQANMEKLVSCGFIRHNKDFASVLTKDADSVLLPHMRIYVHEIRNALNSPVVPAGTESGDPDMATALVEIGDDGSLRFASPELRAAFARCVGMETDYFERIGFVPAHHAQDSRHTIGAALKLRRNRRAL